MAEACCPICWEVEGVDWVTPCGHTFHETCLTTWLTRTARCPVCWQPVPPATPPTPPPLLAPAPPATIPISLVWLCLLLNLLLTLWVAHQAAVWWFLLDGVVYLGGAVVLCCSPRGAVWGLCGHDAGTGLALLGWVVWVHRFGLLPAVVARALLPGLQTWWWLHPVS